MALLQNKSFAQAGAARLQAPKGTLRSVAPTVVHGSSRSVRPALQQPLEMAAPLLAGASVSSVVGRGSRRNLAQALQAFKNGDKLDRPLRVAVVGGGPAGACAAETLAKGGVETYLIERKLDNCKVCKGRGSCTQLLCVCTGCVRRTLLRALFPCCAFL